MAVEAKGGGARRGADGEQPRRRVVVGVTGTAVHAGRIESIDQNSEVRGAKWIGSPGRIGIADKMVRDSQVKRSHDSVVDPIVGAFWDVEPASEDELAVEIADFVEWNLFEKLAWSTKLTQILNAYIRKGVGLFEVSDEIVPLPAQRFKHHPGRGRGMIVGGLHHRQAETIHEWIPSADDPTRLAGVRQWAPGSDVEPAGLTEIIEARNLLRFTWEQEGGDFWGYAPSRPQYGPWKAKQICLVLEMIKHESAHVPTPILNLPDGERASGDDIELAETALKDLRSHEKGYAILPGGFTLKRDTINGTTDIHQTITRCDQQLMSVFGASYEQLGNNGVGSNALAGTQKGTQELVLDRHAEFLAEAINIGQDGHSLIARIVRANYGPNVALPRLCVRSMPTKDWAKSLPLVRNLGDIGFLTPGRKTERFIRWVLTLPQETRPYVPEGTRSRTAPGAAAAKSTEETPA